jgi:hypothetical protein
MRHKFIKFTIPNTLLFVFTGLSLVFPLGLLTLTVGPVRMISDYADSHHWSEDHENSIQKLFLGFFFVIVVLLSYYVTHKLARCQNQNLKTGLLFSLGVILISSVYIFSFKPELLINSSSINQINHSADAEFHFGPYPDEAKMKELKSKNYTAVISLLHHLVIPAEPILMEKEKENADKTGMKLINIPMLPWIVKNDSSVARIKDLAHTLKGKYYVHCYLGKDRANVFRNIIEKENGEVLVTSALKIRNIDTLKAFERGKIFKLKPNVYFTPYPTDDELFGYVLNGKFATVVSIMDPQIKEEKSRIKTEASIMKQYNQAFYNLPLKENATPAQIKALLVSIQKLKEPIIIHSFNSENENSKKFIAAYQKFLQP